MKNMDMPEYLIGNNTPILELGKDSRLLYKLIRLVNIQSNVMSQVFHRLKRILLFKRLITLPSTP